MKLQIVALFIFLSLFGPKPNAFVDFSFLIFLPFIFYFKGINKLNFYLFCIYLYIILCSIAYFKSGYFDTWHYAQPIKSSLLLFGTYGFLQFFNVKYDKLLSLIYKSIIIHSIIIIFFYFFNEYQELYNQLINFVSKSDLRRNGLTNSYGTTSLIHSFGIPLIYFSQNKKFTKLFFILIVLISQILLARVGLYFSILIIIYLLIRENRFLGFIIISVCSFAILQLVVYLDSLNSNNINDDIYIYVSTLKWAFEIFSNIYSDNEVYVSSFDTLNILFYNDNLYEYFFGTGYFGRAEGIYRIKTDISYLLYFSYCGLFGLILISLSHYFLISYKNIIFTTILAIIFVTAIKEPTFFTRGLFNIISLLSFYNIFKPEEIKKSLFN